MKGPPCSVHIQIDHNLCCTVDSWRDWAEVLVFSDKEVKKIASVPPISPSPSNYCKKMKEGTFRPKNRGFMERRFPARDQRAGHCPPFDNYNIIHLWYPTHPSQNQLNQFMRVHVCTLNTVEAVDFPKWRIGCIWTLKESICCPPPLTLSFLVPIRLNKRFFYIFWAVSITFSF